MTTRYEQETTVTTSAGDPMVYVFSTQPKHLRRLRSKPNVVERDGGTADYGMFEIPSEDYDPMRGFKTKRNLTPEQRAALGIRLRKSVTKRPYVDDVFAGDEPKPASMDASTDRSE